MKSIVAILAVVLLSACAHLSPPTDTGEESAAWKAAHHALSLGEFERAGQLFRQLHAERPESVVGREALFYLGAISLDPRNPKWSPSESVESLREYLSFRPETSPKRGPEAQTLLELARQLSLPGESRIPELQPETKIVRQRVVRATEARELVAEVERLKQQLAERELQIQKQKEELERIRKTLTPGP